jgi:hypothetical protein
MSSDLPPVGSPAGLDGGEPEPFWLHAARAIGGLFVGRVRVITAVLPLLFGGVLLTGAWEWGSTVRRQRDDLATLTGRGEARVEASWWRIDFDSAPLGDHGTNWRALTRRELCSRFRFVDGSGGGPVSVACRTYRGLDHGHSLLYAASPELPVRWTDAAGRPSVDLRLTARAEDWLTARPAMWWPLLPQDEATRAGHQECDELEALLLEMDEPVELLLLAAEAAAGPPVAMAFDPERPARALPVPALAAAEAGRADLAYLPFLAVGGGLLWAIGCGIFTWGSRPWVQAVVIAATLLALPWWSGGLDRVLGFLWQPAGELFPFLGPEMVGLPSVVSPRVDEGGDWIGGDAAATAERLRPLSFVTSHYADVLDEVADRLPTAAPGATPDEVLAGAAAAVEAAVLALPEDRLAALVGALYRHGRLDAHGADLLFLPAVHRLSLDGSRPAPARRATLVLSDMATAAPPSPDQPAWRERRRLWRLLVDHPEPIVYNMARR